MAAKLTVLHYSIDNLDQQCDTTLRKTAPSAIGNTTTAVLRKGGISQYQEPISTATVVSQFPSCRCLNSLNMSDFEGNDHSFQVLEDQSNNSNFHVCKGQTDEERREIRKHQRLLQRDIEDRGQDLEVTEARDRNNKIFSKVRFIREAVLDGENVNLIAIKAAQKVDQMIQVRSMASYVFNLL
jgi:hypothetical protein